MPKRKAVAYRRMARRSGKIWREHGVLAKVMQDPRMRPMMDPKKLPFDGRRLFWGGFKAVVDL